MPPATASVWLGRHAPTRASGAAATYVIPPGRRGTPCGRFIPVWTCDQVDPPETSAPVRVQHEGELGGWEVEVAAAQEVKGGVVVARFSFGSPRLGGSWGRDDGSGAGRTMLKRAPPRGLSWAEPGRGGGRRSSGQPPVRGRNLPGRGRLSRHTVRPAAGGLHGYAGLPFLRSAARPPVIRRHASEREARCAVGFGRSERVDPLGRYAVQVPRRRTG
jgi:hypothetical protein